jgi:hypothetical protein
MWTSSLTARPSTDSTDREGSTGVPFRACRGVGRGNWHDAITDRLRGHHTRTGGRARALGAGGVEHAEQCFGGGVQLPSSTTKGPKAAATSASTPALAVGRL